MRGMMWGSLATRVLHVQAAMFSPPRPSFDPMAPGTCWGISRPRGRQFVKTQELIYSQGLQAHQLLRCLQTFFFEGLLRLTQRF